MYQILLEKRAKKFIDRLSRGEQERIVAAIEKLPYMGDVKPLKGHENYFRLRVGDYRIIYKIDQGKLTIVVIDVGNRGQIYNRY